MLDFLQKVPAKCFLYTAYLIVWGGVLGSLYFSEFKNLPPCSLCIIQRGLMYPLVLILGIGIWKKDRWIHHYALPFSILGLIVAGYHNLLVWHLAPADLIVCSVQLPCTIQEFSLFGFITIPLMSFLAFLLITVSLIWHLKKLQTLKDEQISTRIR
ncbi:MAG: disulfide bond formation protein B [Candidatus Vogelbacteria bacterium]|nr:disulfide bond formation protein B [Candidatus Vogelbacteria bacterium]